MTPAALATFFRRDIQDEVTPYLITDDEVYAFMDDAQKMFARLTDYFQDSTTYSSVQVAVSAALSGSPLISFVDSNPDTITRNTGSFITDGFVKDMPITVSNTVSNDGTYTVYSVAAQTLTLYSSDTLAAEASVAGVTMTGTATNPEIVPISERITKIRRAKLASRTTPLTLITLETFENQGLLVDDYGVSTTFAWETDTGTPYVALTNFETNALRLVPIPTTNDTLALLVYRLPLKDITAASSAFEVTEVEYQRMFNDWMQHLAYLKQDADLYDEKLSVEAANRFIANASVVKSDLQRKRYKPGSIRYGGL